MKKQVTISIYIWDQVDAVGDFYLLLEELNKLSIEDVEAVRYSTLNLGFSVAATKDYTLQVNIPFLLYQKLRKCEQINIKRDNLPND